jgi:FkbM family methyltransferase
MRPLQTPIWKTHHGVIGKLVRLPLRLLPPNLKLRVFSGLNRGALWVVGSGINECWMGTYERQVQKVVSQIVRPGAAVWDLGANVGFYTLAFSKLVGPTGSVVAFEADGLNSAYLLQHIKLNKLDNVTVVQAVVYRSPGMISFSIDALGTQHAICGDSRRQIPSISLDSYLANGESSPDVIKIDVEGAEAAVLEGAKQLLQARHPDLIIALHGSEESAECSAFLRDLGYAFFDMQGKLQTEAYGDTVLARKSR